MPILADTVLRPLLEEAYGFAAIELRWVQNENDDIWRVTVSGDRTYQLRVSTIPNWRIPAHVRGRYLEMLRTHDPAPRLIQTCTRSYSYAVDGYCEIEVSEWVDGQDISAWTPGLARQAGARIAEFTSAQEPQPGDRSTWFSYASQDILGRAERTFANSPDWQRLLKGLASALLAPKPSMNASLQPVHGDLHRENVLLTTSGGVALIDFADLGLGSKWYDFATCLSSIHRLGNLDMCTAFVDGYRSVIPEMPSPQQLSCELLLRDVAIATHLVAHDVREDWVDGRVRGLLRDGQQALTLGHHRHAAVLSGPYT